MSHHNDPRNTPELLAALSAHGLTTTEPSQLSDAFRLGYWQAQRETIVAAAVFHGTTISLPPPARHGTILQSIALVWGRNAMAVQPENEGFLTSAGRFVNRVEGFHIANAASQIKHKSGNIGEPTLYSEDLW